MKIKSSQGLGKWQEVLQPVDDMPDPASTDIRRVLTGAVRAQNLVILTGLGTSLCVQKSGKRAAPTMGDLLAQIKDAFDVANMVGEPDGGPRWAKFLALANVPADNVDLEYLMSRATTAAEFLPGNDAKTLRKLVSTAEDIIRDEVDFMDDAIDLPVHEAFLRRVARRSSRRARTKLFTTNYDLCFETAARRSGFVVVDGFAFGSEAYFDSNQFSYDVVRRSAGEEKSEFIESLFHLYKIHGSIDWELSPATGRIAKRPGTEKPLLIYPKSTKYELAFSQPYIEIMGTLQASLRTPNTTLVVVGFGFNDKHISEPIIGAIKGNLSLNVVAINPDIEKASDAGGNAYLNTIGTLIENGDARLALIAGKFEDIVPMVPDVIAETELEKHAERLRNMSQKHG
ncbi:SIR2 family protein [Sinorhizobium meliloti]|uniref:SIR2 family protein n=1 Tax=Rhizobium meliloti TaxID=382 RepID=UPI000D1F4D9C|nr:SIR2 family protein [Sinorhizobium meliloti]RMI22759.1 SIR2 family protein [Sinorhizobium meliloti]RVK57423.1 SIR2 family protein [Sinorhizobium meliloti]